MTKRQSQRWILYSYGDNEECKRHEQRLRDLSYTEIKTTKSGREGWKYVYHKKNKVHGWKL